MILDRIDWSKASVLGTVFVVFMKRISGILLKRILSYGLAFLVIGFSSIEAATFRVPGDHRTIQAAIDAARPGDNIWVAQGTYDENITLRENVKLEGGWNAGFTGRNWELWRSIIDGGGRGTVVTGAQGATLDGFTIQNGNARLGGGILLENVSMTIKHNTIINNNATGGGGGIEIGSIPRGATDTDITHNVIQNNHTDGKGGGIYVSNSHGWINIVNNIIGGLEMGNTAIEFGGGVLIEACPTVNIEGNEITYNDGGSYAGGVHVAGATPNTMIKDNAIQNNHARLGGAGIYLQGGTIITRNHISGNYTDREGRGGGMWLEGTDRYDPKVENNFIYGNIAGTMGGDGIYINAGRFPRIINNTIVRNGIITERRDGKGVYVVGGVRCILKNNIIWDNRNDLYAERPSCEVSYNDIGSGGFAGVDDNIMEDPLFVDVHDLHIQVSSPCRDAGTSADAPRDDIDKDTRGRQVDIGADEVEVPLTTAIGLLIISICLLLSGMASFRGSKEESLGDYQNGRE